MPRTPKRRPKAEAKVKEKLKARSARPKQRYLPGAEPTEHPDVIAAAEAYVEARDERMVCSKTESQRHDSLLLAMMAHNLTEYTLPDDRKVIVDLHRKCKVRKPNEERDEE